MEIYQENFPYNNISEMALEANKPLVVVVVVVVVEAKLH